MDVAIIDYKMGNLHSVQAACRKVGLTSVITTDSNQISNAKIAILPGVGAFGEAMSNLLELKLDAGISKFIETGKPFIGICLGMQLLFDTSEEFGSHKGLGIINGNVKKFEFRRNQGVKYPVPQVGWNQIKQNANTWDETILRSTANEDFMYFVHSYYVEPEDESIILSTTTYGDTEYCSSIQLNNIFAIQFHPEKSGTVGLKIYKTLKEIYG